MAVTYKDAGVDLQQYAQAMNRLPALMHRTFGPRVLKNDGGFAGLFQLDFNSKLFARNYQEPILVAGTDGVGTKLKLAQTADRHDTVGIDLVAMCVNDLICTGAEPLFFLDYVALGKDDPDRLEQIVRGISDGCVESDAALLGGETAIMPDMYGDDDYDLAGFAVGVVERSHLINGSAVQPGDTILGIASNGLHSNGFSLVRKILSNAKVDLETIPKEFGHSVIEECLRPTAIYAKVVRRVLGHYRVKQVVHSIAHITGGGLQENLERVLPAGVDAIIDRGSWQRPAIFPWLQKLGGVEEAEMDRVFNQGIGLVMVVSDYYAAAIEKQINATGHQVYRLGEITEGTGTCKWKNA